MIFLENAYLPTSTFNEIVSLFVASAKENQNDTQTVHTIKNGRLTELQTEVHTLKIEWVLEADMVVPLSIDNEPAAAQKLWAPIPITKHQTQITDIVECTESLNEKDRSQYGTSLNNAVEALKENKIDLERGVQITQVKRIRDIPPPGFPKSKRGTMLIQRKSGIRKHFKRNNARNNPRFIRPGTCASLISKYIKCHEKGHWAGENECQGKKNTENGKIPLTEGNVYHAEKMVLKAIMKIQNGIKTKNVFPLVGSEYLPADPNLIIDSGAPICTE